MKKFLVTIYMNDQGSKIAAIKIVRTLFGLGLVDGKKLVEANQQQSVIVALNSDQVSKVVEYTYNRAIGEPELFIQNIKEVEDFMLDFSANVGI